ncbi:MAG: adenosylmethionine decarboxylase [Sulfolobus sp.]|jgi:S-adenosylmethionine decarboxylase|nr:adenosylmethionine decarboxylase [Sulfolobus sp.]
MRGALAQIPTVVGKQVYGELYDCNVETLKDEQRLREIVTNAARIGNMTLLDVKSWKIGEGVSVMAIVLESHITIHTWPEHAFATVDVYSCGAHTDPKKAYLYIVEQLGAKRYTIKEADRSLEF